MPMRLLFVSLEFSAAAFSGNGFYSQAQVQDLCLLGHNVLVIAGKPPGFTEESNKHGAKALLEVSLPSWGRIDRHSAHEHFANGCSVFRASVLEFRPELALGVDWSAREALGNATKDHPVPYFYLNYRVFLRSCEPQDESFYRQQELASVLAAKLTIALCSSDSAFIKRNLLKDHPEIDSPKVLLPPLRADFAKKQLLTPSLPLHAHSSAAKIQPFDNNVPGGEARRFLTCCVRLSPEKEPDRFIEIVEELSNKGSLKMLQVIPVLCASTASDYAAALKARFKASVPSAVVVEKFLQAEELASLYANTLLNVHPPRTEAYGMTIVEAASQGAASVINTGGGVGAAELLDARNEEILELDFDLPSAALAGQVASLLSDPDRLTAIGRRAAERAHSWTGEANAKELIKLIQQATQKH